jgi:hypothetical protein
MMGFNYDRIAKLAQKQIERFGQTVTIARRVQGSYNTVTSAATVTETTQTAKGVTDVYNLKEVDGNLVQTGDIKVILSALGITAPTVNDKVTLLDGTIWVVKGVDPVSPGGVPIIYTCQLRK